MKVPITYAQKEKMLTRVIEAPNADRKSASVTLPIMSFEITSLAYDGDRKLKTTGRSAYLNTAIPSSLTYQYNPVPYNLGFQLNIWVKNYEDGAKIVEQILPYFTPDFTITVVMIPELGVKTEVPIILNTLTQNDAYETSEKENQPIIWTLDFTIKANFWGPIKNGPIILFANTNFKVNGSNVSSSWSSVQPGLTANGQPTSNAYLSVPANTILATSDFGYITNYGTINDDAELIFTADMTFTTDTTLISVDQLGPHNYIT